MDQVKLLLQSITENVATEDDADGADDGDTGVGQDIEANTRTGASTRIRASSGRLIASDMQVVREIVRMRSRLKASQMEMHRHAVIGGNLSYRIYPPSQITPLTFLLSHSSFHITPFT